VDDDGFVLELLGDFLKEEKYNVVTASSGTEAITKLSALKIDIALVDYKMPGIDGLQTIEELLKIDQDVVAILMTGFPTVDSSVKAIKMGASDYIVKPFKLEEVSLSVRKAVRARDMKLEVKNLRKKIQELEKNVIEKRDSIKINQHLGVVTTLEGYSTRVVNPGESTNETPDPKSS
jgi:DNA-binding NtrC family response regulator